MKLLFDTLEQKLLPYPRMDEEPVVGLDVRYLEMNVIQEQAPTYNEETHYLTSTVSIDAEEKIVTRGYAIAEIPAPNAEEIALDRANKRLAFYQKMLAQINAENELLGFNSTQIQACMQLLLPIKSALEVGIVEGSLYLLMQIEPTSEYPAERKAAHVAMFQEFLETL